MLPAPGPSERAFPPEEQPVSSDLGIADQAGVGGEEMLVEVESLGDRAVYGEVIL